jgi:uncharacterized protein (DUF2147 family)
MKKNILILIVAAFALLPMSLYAQSNKMLGKWYTIDEDGNRKSIVVITKNPNGMFEGTIEKLLTGDPDRKCVNCTGAEKNKTLKGMKIIRSLREDGSKLTGGTILDPANGKVYNCTVSLDKKSGDLKVRGSLDKSGIIGRNQVWKRAE